MGFPMKKLMMWIKTTCYIFKTNIHSLPEPRKHDGSIMMHMLKDNQRKWVQPLQESNPHMHENRYQRQTSWQWTHGTTHRVNLTVYKYCIQQSQNISNTRVHKHAVLISLKWRHWPEVQIWQPMDGGRINRIISPQKAALKQSIVIPDGQTVRRRSSLYNTTGAAAAAAAAGVGSSITKEFSRSSSSKSEIHFQ